MIRSYTYAHPLPFGDSYWVKTSDVEPLVKNIRLLLNNIYEFGAPTGQEYLDAVDDALANLTKEV